MKRPSQANQVAPVGLVRAATAGSSVNECPATVAEPCIHHFLVASPDGATVAAVCKHCNLERTYPTAGVDMHWREFREVPTPHTQGGWDRSIG